MRTASLHTGDLIEVCVRGVKFAARFDRRDRGEVCARCGEELVDPARPCEGCRLDRIEEAVSTLCAAAKSGGDKALLARAEAVRTLRSCGYSAEQMLRARGLAVEGKTVEEILESLIADERAVAA